MKSLLAMLMMLTFLVMGLLGCDRDDEGGDGPFDKLLRNERPNRNTMPMMPIDGVKSNAVEVDVKKGVVGEYFQVEIESSGKLVLLDDSHDYGECTADNLSVSIALLRYDQDGDLLSLTFMHKRFGISVEKGVYVLRFDIKSDAECGSVRLNYQFQFISENGSAAKNKNSHDGHNIPDDGSDSSGVGDDSGDSSNDDDVDDDDVDDDDDDVGSDLTADDQGYISYWYIASDGDCVEKKSWSIYELLEVYDMERHDYGVRRFEREKTSGHVLFKFGVEKLYSDSDSYTYNLVWFQLDTVEIADDLEQQLTAGKDVYLTNDSRCKNIDPNTDWIEVDDSSDVIVF